jgi:hypothetical protein
VGAYDPVRALSCKLEVREISDTSASCIGGCPDFCIVASCNGIAVGDKLAHRVVMVQGELAANGDRLRPATKWSFRAEAMKHNSDIAARWTYGIDEGKTGKRSRLPCTAITLPVAERARFRPHVAKSVSKCLSVTGFRQGAVSWETAR